MFAGMTFTIFDAVATVVNNINRLVLFDRNIALMSMYNENDYT